MATYLATFGFARWTMFHLVSHTRLTAAAVVLVLLPLAQALPALEALVLVALVLVLLNVREWLGDDRTGWRARSGTTAA